MTAMRAIAFHVIITAYGFWLPNDPRARVIAQAFGRRSIRYVEDNPLKEGLRRQTWSFVTP
jgi:hypothetical protein